jgi:heme exporter protein D
MNDSHGLFIAAAYGLTALALILEWLVLASRKRAALARAARERDADESVALSR